MIFTPDSNFFILAKEGEEVEIWKMASGEQTHRIILRENFNVFQFGVDKTSTLLSISRDDTTIEIVEITTGKIYLNPIVLIFFIKKIVYSSFNKFFFVSEKIGITHGADHNIRIWEFLTGRRAGILTGHTDKIVDLVVIDEDVVLTASLDLSLRIWSLEEKACLAIHPVSF